MSKIKKINYFITYMLIIISVFLINVFVNSGIFNDYQTSIFINVCINLILAVSLNIAVGCLGQITLGHAGFMSVGAYVAAIFQTSMGLNGISGYLISILIGAIVAGIIGILVGIPALRLKGDYLAIITLAFGEIIRVIIEALDITGGASGYMDIVEFTNPTIIYLITVLSIVFMYSAMTTRQGLAILAIREDEIASSASGINVVYYKTFAFVLSAIFAGLAGGIYAHYNGMLQAKLFDFNMSINILVMVVLGGMGSFTGSIFAAIVLTVIPEVLREFNEYRMIVYALVLVLTMIFKPTGLFGRNEFILSKITSKFIKNK